MSKFNDAVSELESIKKEFERLKTEKEILIVFNNQPDEDESQEKSYLEDLRENVAMYIVAISHIACLREDIGHVVKSADKAAVFAGVTKLKRICAEYEQVENTTLTQKIRSRTSEKTQGKLLKFEKASDTICRKKEKELEMSPRQESLRQMLIFRKIMLYQTVDIETLLLKI